MPDNRSRIEKLRAMADQTASPQEAEIARRILDEMEDQERVWGTPGDPESIFQTFARSRPSSIREDAFRVFAQAFGFRVDWDQRTAYWEGDLRKGNAPIAAMVRALRTPQVQEGSPSRVESGPDEIE